MAAARKNLDAFIRGKGGRAPMVDASTKATGKDGTLKANFENGTVYLKAKSGAVRVKWSKGEAVAVPAGIYRVFNYAVEAEKDGVFWCLSGSGPAGRIVEIKAGEETKLELDLAVHVKLQTFKEEGELVANLSIGGDGGMGLSVIKVDNRVPVSFEIQDGDGKKLAGKGMSYG